MKIDISCIYLFKFILTIKINNKSDYEFRKSLLHVEECPIESYN